MRPQSIALFVLVLPFGATAAELSPAERGRKALLECAYVPPSWSPKAIENAWKQWPGVTSKPTDYDRAFRDYYGLHPAPYPNNDLPMGLRPSSFLLMKGINVD